MLPVPTDLQEFAALALHNAMRAALNVAEFLPIFDGILIATEPAGRLYGARVFFQPPVKCVWVAPDGSSEYGVYEQKRKDTQTPLTARYYFISDIADLTLADVFENPPDSTG